eukprot:TRINITY_DN36273_c0_g1_i1.p1 TRINITY_DN36273_c0_g1~~TRINITY_DN36273_c0_g1_i1.p1  ORF type:complete len:197 (+),score=43.01 TRINITY_DN36273_c0_g1_i1:79-669(+)
MGDKPFEKQKWDVTNYVESTCACLSTLGILGWTQKRLVLEADEAVLTAVNNCTQRVLRRRYEELGPVDAYRNCGCWVLTSDFFSAGGGISPAFGCSRRSLDEISEALEYRRARCKEKMQQQQQGQLAAVKRQVEYLDRKVDYILEHFRIEVPPEQEIMRTTTTQRYSQVVSPRAGLFDALPDLEMHELALSSNKSA